MYLLRQSTEEDLKPVHKLSLTYDIAALEVFLPFLSYTVSLIFCDLQCPRQPQAASNKDDLNEHPYLGIYMRKTERSEVLYKGVGWFALPHYQLVLVDV